MDQSTPIPTPYTYAGGVAKFERLTEVFYDKVLKDEVLEPVFRHMAAEHSRHVAHFLAEVFMGPKYYSDQFGNEALRRMVGKHIGKKLQESQRKRWVELLLQSADEIGLPNDPEFRSVFVGHIEWGTRVALINSQFTENPTSDEDVIPQWGWGEVKGPYEVVGSLFRPKGNAQHPTSISVDMHWKKLSQSGFALYSHDKQVGSMTINFAYGSQAADCLWEEKRFIIRRTGFWKSGVEMEDVSTKDILLTASLKKWYSNRLTVEAFGEQLELKVWNNPMAEWVLEKNENTVLAYGLSTDSGATRVRITAAGSGAHPFFHFFIWYLFFPIAQENGGDDLPFYFQLSQ